MEQLQQEYHELLEENQELQRQLKMMKEQSRYTTPETTSPHYQKQDQLKLNETTLSPSPSLTDYQTSQSDTTTALNGVLVNGQNLGENLISSLKPADIRERCHSVSELNGAIPQENLSRLVKREHRALTAMMRSYNFQSVQKGNGNYQIIRRPDYIIKALRKAGLLDAYMLCMPMRVGNFTRTGFNASIGWVWKNQEEIMDAISDHTPYHPFEGFTVLLLGSMMATLNGYVLAESPILSSMADYLDQMNRSEQNKFLQTKSI